MRLPLDFRIKQPARELIFLTPSGRAEFSAVELPDDTVSEGTLILATLRSHDQWNTTVYSDNDRYRGIKNLRTLIFMNEQDMADRGIKEFDAVDIVATRGTAASARCTATRLCRTAFPRATRPGTCPR